MCTARTVDALATNGSNYVSVVELPNYSMSYNFISSPIDYCSIELLGLDG